MTHCLIPCWLVLSLSFERFPLLSKVYAQLFQFRQDQFVRALVRKMTTFALGRPLTFADRASIDRITATLRKEGDGLATLVRLIATSELFRSR